MRIIPVFVVSLALFGLSVPASAQGLTFYACSVDGKVVPGSIQVGTAPECGSGVVVSWGQTAPAAPQVKVVGGIVGLGGDVLVGTGFTATRTATGMYTLTFPAGTFTTVPSVTVAPFGIAGAYGNPVVAALWYYGNGSAVVDIRMSATTPGQTLYDNAFFFIAAGTQP